MTKSKLKVWEFPLRSGIKIRQRLNNQKKDKSLTFSYRVSIPTKVSGKRCIHYKQFKEKADAEQWASQECRKYKEYGTEAQEIPLSQRIEAAEVFELIRPQGLTLRSIAEHYLELLKKCNASGLNLDSVVDFGVSRLKPVGGHKTFTEVADELLNLKKGYHLAESSINDFSNRVKKASQAFGSTPIHLLEAKDVKEWLGSVDLMPRTKKNYLMILREVFKYAKQKSYLIDNPLDTLTRYDSKSIHGLESTDIREPNILTVSQARQLLETAKIHPELGLLAALTLGLFCGIRTEELKKLEWDAVHLDAEKPFLVISSKIAKKRRIRNVDIPDNAISWLKTCSKTDGPVAENNYISHYQKRFLKLQKLAGFGEWTQSGGKPIWRSTWRENSIRHSFGSYHYALHGDSMLTSRLMGHKEGDSVLFDHYRALVNRNSAEQYFAIQYQ